MIQTLGLTQSAKIVGNVDNVAALLQQAYCFVLPSRGEGLPNALLEALASGLPAVVTRVSGSEDVVSAGVNGLVVPPEDEVALAAALDQILSDENFAAGLSAKARSSVAETYSVDRVKSAYLDLYARLIDSRQQSHRTRPDGSPPTRLRSNQCSE
jgi:glycosyltransferase involved in cell wall biosynthesis